MATEKKAAPDWERIEGDYRAGVLSVREIAALQGISHTAIQKKAKAEGWERDLSKRIQAKAEALVAKREVANQVATETKAATERSIVDANADMLAHVHLTQRKDVGRARTLAMSLLAELEAETSNIELFEQLGEMLRSDDEKGQDRRNDLYQKVISSVGRIDSMKKLSDTLKTLIGLEREAYGISTPQEVNLNANIKSDRKPQEMTDDELAAIAAGGSARTAD
ncbi:hypothetical protein [Paraburkholderia dilworthii]|uniref:hypothetical protein n=1 Tax=Paraburkholderia dilworthii TaxID=948106 RepID=UPI0003FA71EB|nr:hypothetical protein [Paraburkholderia dilworthii]